MKITFETATVTPGEVAGILALLAAVSPDVLTAALDGLNETAVTLPLTVGADPAKVFAVAPMAPLSPESEEEPASPPASAPVAAAPASPSPAAPAPTAAANPGGVEVDKEGVPWDGRIHATVEGGGGKITKDGVWRAKRGVSADAKAAVVAELKAALAAGGAPVPSAAPVAAPPPPSAPASPVPAAEPAPSAPPPPAAPVAPAPVADPTVAPAPAAAFAAIMGKVTQAQTAGKITAETVTACLAGLGLAQLRDLLTRPDLIPSFEATVDAMMGA